MKQLKHKRKHALRSIVLMLIMKNMLLSSSLSAQTGVRGTVYDEEGEVITGATVQSEGTKTGTITDANGRFSINAPANGTLKVSFLGYITQNVPIKGRDELRINLQPDTKALDEVVVVGYGTVLKSDLTGSVSSLKVEKIEEKPYSTMEQMLQGQTAGVQITQNTGALGGGMTFMVRGANSMSGNNQPLVVIDGYPVESGNFAITMGAEGTYPGDTDGLNALSSIAPNDIESIEILKDASSTAIYGSRGANGVVLVTTKTGKAGKEKINYVFRNDWSYLPNTIEVLSTAEFIAYCNEGYMDKNNGSAMYSQSEIERYKAIDTHWQDLIYQTGLTQSHQLNVSGGDRKMKYSLSLQYLGQDGIIKNSRFDRGTVMLNLNREVNSKFSLNFSVNGNRSVNKAVAQSNNNANTPSSSVIAGALRTPPIYKDYEEDEIAAISGTTNPLTMVTKASDVMTYTLIRANGSVDYKATKDITFKYRAGGNISYGERQYYMPRDTYLGNQRGGYAYTGNIKKFDYLSELTASYIKTFAKKHSVNAVAGYTWQFWRNTSEGQAVAGFPSDRQTYYNLGAATTINKPQNAVTEWALASAIGRINYVFNKKYMLTSTVRYDGSSRLYRGDRWDIFPSIALGWNMHSEPFMRKRSFFSKWKWSASYGLYGNQTVSVGAIVPQYAISSGVLNQTVTTAYAPRSLSNEYLAWEKTAQTNIGVDWGFLKNRINLSVDFYRKLSTDLLLSIPVPRSTGYSSYTDNIGEVENKGIEFDLVSYILNGKLKWKMQGNISFNRNKILIFDGTQTAFAGPSFGSVGKQSLNIAMVGHPIGSFYGYRIIGIYQTQEEVLNSPVDPAGAAPGYFKFADLNGDNEITDADREIIGNPYPDYIFGWNNDFSWKGFNLNLFVQGSIGQDVINANRYYLDALTGTSVNVNRTAYRNRWTGPGTGNTYPKIVSSTSQLPFSGRFSDFIVEDASYIRLKSITLSYTVPTDRIRWLQNLKIFITGTNLFTFTDYTGYDPEINSRGRNSMTPGIDNGSIPQYRSFSTGFNIEF
jgi:TonB-linked SusC/RagA family outer membrane protein